MLPIRDLWPALSFVFYGGKRVNTVAFCHRCDVYAAVFELDVATALRQSLDGETVDAELPLNVGMSKPAGGLRDTVSAPAG